MLKQLLVVLVVAMSAVVMTACGDDSSKDDSTTTATTETTETTDTTATTGTDGGAATDDTAKVGALKLANDGDNLAFDTTKLTAPAGTVTIEFTNDSSIPHDVHVENADGEEVGDATDLISGGETATFTAQLEPGTYTYYCAPHRSSGMEGTLTVS